MVGKPNVQRSKHKKKLIVRKTVIPIVFFPKTRISKNRHPEERKTALYADFYGTMYTVEGHTA